MGLLKILAVFIAFFSLSFAIAPPAVQNLFIINAATYLALDSNTAGSAYILSPNWGAYQRWYLSGSSLNAVYIHDLATGRVLDSNSGGSVYTSPYGIGNSYQQWKVFWDTANLFRIQNVATSRYLNRVQPSNTLSTITIDGSYIAQNIRWGLQNNTVENQPQNPPVFASAVTITSYAKNQVLDNNSGGTVYLLNPTSSSANQKWSLTGKTYGSGAVYITNYGTMRNLDADSSHNVFTATYSDTDSYLTWNIQYSGTSDWWYIQDYTGNYLCWDNTANAVKTWTSSSNACWWSFAATA